MEHHCVPGRVSWVLDTFFMNPFMYKTWSMSINDEEVVVLKGALDQSIGKKISLYSFVFNLMLMLFSYFGLL